MAKQPKQDPAPQQNAVPSQLPLDRETMDALVAENEKICGELELAAKNSQRLETMIEEEKDRFLRLLAEYDNFKKRTTKEKQQIYGDAKADALTAFLPIIDNLRRALDGADEAQSMKKGIEMILNQTGETLRGFGIEEIEALGQTFDPTLHNAAMHIEDDAYGEQEICEVFQTGYKIGDRIIRHAVVKVAN